MEANITRIMWIVIVLAAISLAVWFAWSIFGGTMRGTVDFQAYAFEMFYDGTNDWGYFRLKNVGSVDITSLSLTITDSSGNTYTPTASNTPSGTNPLPPGEEWQIQLTDLGDISGVGRYRLTVTAQAADGRTVSHEYTIYVRYP